MSTITNTPAAAARPRARLRRILGWLAGILVTLLLVGYLVVSAIAANTLTIPKRVFSNETPALAGAAFQDVSFPARGGDVQISGWFLPNTSSKRVVVLIHGWNGSRTSEFQGDFPEFAAALNKRGFNILMIDMRGHGRSGDAHFSFGINERRDVEGAVDWLKGQGFAPGSIGALGVSMGAATAIGAAADDPEIGALVADCSYAEVYSLIESKWTKQTPLPQIFLPSTLLMGRLLFGYDIGSARPVDEVDEIAPRPLLIIHGAADGFTPVSHGRALKAADPGAEYWEVPGADHGASYRADPAAYLARVAAFFDTSLR